MTLQPSNDSRFLRTLLQFSKRAAGETAELGRSGVELLGVIGAACLECGEPAAEARQFIRRQLADSFGDQLFAGYICRASPDTRMLAPGSEVISALSRDGRPISCP